MPELNPSPKFPITEKPRLSPNPKSTLEFKDGGRGTPVIVNNPPRVAIDPTEESAEIEALRAYVGEELAEKESLSNKVTSIGETASNAKYPSEKAVKDYVQSVVLGAIEEAY